MLKRDIPERVWFFDMEWVPDAAASRRLFADLPADATEKTRSKGFGTNIRGPTAEFLF